MIGCVGGFNCISNWQNHRHKKSLLSLQLHSILRDRNWNEYEMVLTIPNSRQLWADLKRSTFLKIPVIIFSVCLSVHQRAGWGFAVGGVPQSLVPGPFYGGMGTPGRTAVLHPPPTNTGVATPTPWLGQGCPSPALPRPGQGYTHILPPNPHPTPTPHREQVVPRSVCIL